MLSRYAHAIATRPRATLVAVAVTTLLMIVGATLTEPSEGGLESFVDPTSEIGQTLETLQRKFPDRGRSVAIQVIARGDVITPEAITELITRVETATNDPVVTPTLDLTRPPVTYASLIAELAGARSALDEAAIDAALAIDPTDDPVAAELDELLIRDENGDVTAGVGVITQQRGRADVSQLTDAGAVIADILGAGNDDRLAVTTVSTASFDDALQDGIADTQVLIPITLAAIVAVLSLFYRRIGDTLITLGGILISIIWFAGLQGLLGPNGVGAVGPADIVATIIPVMMIGLSVDYALQVLGHRREHLATDGNEAATERSISFAGSAIALGATTTAIAFATNLAGPLPPLRDFGLLAAAGIFAALVVMTSFVPATRVLVDRRRTRRSRSIDQPAIADGVRPLIDRVRRLTVFSATRPVLTLIASFIVIAGAFIYGLGVTTTFADSDFLPDGHPVTADLELLGDELGGNRSIVSILIEGDLTDDQVAANLEELDLLLRSSELNAVVIGAPDPGPTDLAVTALSGDGRTGLITVPVRIENPTVASDLIDTIEHAWTTERASLAVTGDEILSTLISSEITASQRLGTAITIATALILLLGYFFTTDRRPTMALVAIAPVIGVLGIVLATMRATGIVYNPLTALLTSLTIGLGLDYTIHFTHRFLAEQRTAPTTAAIDATAANTGAALIASAATTIAGFAVLSFAPVSVISELGALTTITIAATVITTTTMLPALLALTRRDERSRHLTGRQLRSERAGSTGTTARTR